MKEIILPVTNTFSLTPPIDKVDYSQYEKVGDSYLVPLGNMVSPEKQKEIDIARLNGGKILYATTSIERKVEQILLDYFLGPFEGHNEKRVIFENDVIQSSSFSYSFKKGLLRKIVDSHELLHGKNKNKINKYLTDIMNWRNAFAHGNIKYNEPKGCLIEYYAAGKKTDILDDVYWEKIEKTFYECESLLKELDKNISSLYLEDNSNK